MKTIIPRDIALREDGVGFSSGVETAVCCAPSFSLILRRGCDEGPISCWSPGESDKASRSEFSYVTAFELL